MTLHKLSIIGGALAFALCSFVPAPASFGAFSGAAEAAGSSHGSIKGKKKKKAKRKGKRKKASATQAAASSAKKGKRKAEGKTSKAGPAKVAAKPRSTTRKTRKSSKRGKRYAGKFEKLGAAQKTSAPPRAAKKTRKRKKRSAPAAKMAVNTAKKGKRSGNGKTSRTGANPAGPRAATPKALSDSGVSSVITRQQTPGPARDVVQKAKQGKKSKFYFTGFFGKLRSMFSGKKPAK